MRVRLTWQEYAGSFAGAGLVVVAIFALTDGLHGRLLGLLAAPVFLICGLTVLRLVDRHIRNRFQARTDESRQMLVGKRDR